MTIKEQDKIERECKMASIVLENYLDGAVSDYENGCLDNSEIIDGCINTLYLIGDFGSAMDYEKRMKEAKQQRGE